jgi:hypothetical protein
MYTFTAYDGAVYLKSWLLAAHEAYSWLKSPHASALPTGARPQGEGTKVEHVLQVPESQRIDVGQGMYSLTRLLVKRDISLGSELARLYSPSL